MSNSTKLINLPVILLDCPYCGSEGNPKIVADSLLRNVICLNCGLESAYQSFNSPPTAEDMWNALPREPRPNKQVPGVNS